MKTSSLGDVVHNLPVASDIAAAVPGALVDWVVEESFAAIPRLHPAVRRTIPVALRRWRKGWWRASVRAELADFVRDLRRERYDAVVDTQGLLKSALVTRCARGPKYGLDWLSSREPLGLFYDRTFRVPWGGQAVERNRSLAAQALSYAPGSQIRYGIEAARGAVPWLPTGPYAVLLHATSANRKLWPEARWIELGRALAERGVGAVLPWGGAHERSRSERLSAALPGSVVPPALDIAALAGVLANARFAIGVDTGLTHLAGALGVPTLGIYSATDPARTGLYGCARALNLGGRGRVPAVDDVIGALERVSP